jgi:hypothetical protein
MPMRKLGDRSIAQIREGARGLTGATRTAYVREMADHFQVTVSTVNRILRQDGPARARRSDAGQSRHGITDEIIEEALALYWHDHHPLKDCVAIMKRDGKIPLDRFCAATLLRELKKRTGGGAKNFRKLSEAKNGVVRPHRTIHFRYRAPYSNHTWQWDATRAGQFYIKHGGGLGYQSPDEVRKNKPLVNPKGRECWILGVKDDFSGMVFYRAYPFMNSMSFNDFMFIAMKNKESWPWFFPLHGRPEHFRTDGDGRVLCAPSQRWMQGIGIEHETAKKNPNWNGKIERSFLSSQGIQNATRLQKFNLDWLNLLLLDYCMGYNWNPQRAVDDEIPAERYMSSVQTIYAISSDRELWNSMFWDEYDLLIHGDLGFHIKGTHYQLPDVAPFNEMANLHATVRWNRFELDKVTVLWKGSAFEAPLIPWREFSTAEHYHWPKINAVEALCDRVAAIDTATAVKPASRWGNHLADNANVVGFWKPRTEPVIVAAPAPSVISISDALEMARIKLVGEYGLLTPALANEFKSRLSEPHHGATRAEVEKVLDEMAALHAVEA